MPPLPPPASAPPGYCLPPSPQEGNGTPVGPSRAWTQDRLLGWGRERATAFCRANGIPVMAVENVPKDKWHVHACGYWRPVKGNPDEGRCRVCPPLCSRPALEQCFRMWSWPGGVSDATPYGVVAHELGHHADWMASRALGREVSGWQGVYSGEVMLRSGEKPLTSYCPDFTEWFAEMFRLFVTNHALLKIIRPRTWAELTGDGWVPVSDPSWEKALGCRPPARVYDRLLKR